MKLVDPSTLHRKFGDMGHPGCRHYGNNHVAPPPDCHYAQGTMQAGESGFSPEALRQLTTQAADAADHAYAPYSKFRVGAALLLQNGAIVTGANVENASYGLTICAERSAVVRAVAEHGPEMRVLACAITNLNQAASPPCGACLQVLSEFMMPASRIIFRGQSDWEDYRFEEVFPHRFKLNYAL